MAGAFTQAFGRRRVQALLPDAIVVSAPTRAGHVVRIVRWHGPGAKLCRGVTNWIASCHLALP